MGNRAVITFDQTYNAPCIYLHWNGGRASVEGFLAAARALGLNYCAPGNEAETMDRLAELLATWFFNCNVGHNVYRYEYGAADRDNYDNGVYLLNRDMTIGGRLFARNAEEIDLEKTEAIAEAITNTAPAFN